MRAYTLSILTQLADTGSPIVEKEIIDWVNNKLAKGQKRTSIRNFQVIYLARRRKKKKLEPKYIVVVVTQDSSIAKGLVVIDLIDCIKPGTINYDLVHEGGSDEDNLANAKYAISMARKIGARVYALPEDITEVKQKMVMTVFSTLMARDYVPNMDSKNNWRDSFAPLVCLHPKAGVCYGLLCGFLLTQKDFFFSFFLYCFKGKENQNPAFPGGITVDIMHWPVH